MSTKWTLDSCPCVLLYDGKFTNVRFEVRCKQHAAFEGQELFDAVLAHCGSFTTKEHKEAERKRIILLGDN